MTAPRELENAMNRQERRPSLTLPLLGAAIAVALLTWASFAEDAAPVAEESSAPLTPDSTMVPAPTAVRAEAGPTDTALVFVLETRSRLYEGWKEESRVHMNEPFFLADTQLRARVTRFLPDFRIDRGQFVSASNALLNPAAHVYVYADSGAVDSAWAFQNFPPHFSPRSFWSFQLKEVIGYQSDSLSAAPAKEESR